MITMHICNLQTWEAEVEVSRIQGYSILRGEFKAILCSIRCCLKKGRGVEKEEEVRKRGRKGGRERRKRHTKREGELLFYQSHINYLIVSPILTYSPNHWHHLFEYLVMFGIEGNCSIKVQDWVILVEFYFTKSPMIKGFCKVRICFHSFCKRVQSLEDYIEAHTT